MKGPSLWLYQAKGYDEGYAAKQNLVEEEDTCA